MNESNIDILIVDDDLFLLKILSGYLTPENGFTTTIASDGKEALRKLKAKSFDIVLTDIIMPVTDGIELISEFRKFNKSTPIIAMSGGDLQNKADEMVDFAHYFADRTLQKPFTKQELIKTLESVLNMRMTDVMKLF